MLLHRQLNFVRPFKRISEHHHRLLRAGNQAQLLMFAVQICERQGAAMLGNEMCKLGKPWKERDKRVHTRH